MCLELNKEQMIWWSKSNCFRHSICSWSMSLLLDWNGSQKGAIGRRSAFVQSNRRERHADSLFLSVPDVCIVYKRGKALFPNEQKAPKIKTWALHKRQVDEASRMLQKNRPKWQMNLECKIHWKQEERRLKRKMPGIQLCVCRNQSGVRLGCVLHGYVVKNFWRKTRVHVDLHVQLAYTHG